MAKFKRYDSYKNSGVEWLGEIPSHWEIVRLGSKFIERKEKVSDKDFKPLSVTKTGVVPQLDSAAKTDDGDNRKLVRKDDFVINSRSDRKGSSGLSKFEGSVSLINIVLKPLDINLEYSNFMLKCNGFIEEFYRNGHGIVADLWTTRFWDMKSIMLPLPPKYEQEKIASYLDGKIARIDTAISGKEKLIELLKEQKQILINDAITKGINKNAKFKNSGVEWLGEIPSHWEKISIKRLITLLTDYTANGSFADLAKNVQYLDEPNYAQLIRLTDIRNDFKEKGVYISKKSYEYLSKSSLFGGELLMANVGAYSGYSFLLPEKLNFKASLAPNMFLIKFNQKQIDNKFVFYALNCHVILNRLVLIATSTAQPKLNKDNVRSIFLPLPPKDEQEKIVEYIETKTAKIDKLLNLEQECIKSLKEYKASLIDSVVTGKVRII